MTDYEVGIGMYRLFYPLTALEITHDTRRNTLTFKTPDDAGGPDRFELFTLRLDRFGSFAADLQRLSDKWRKSGSRHSQTLPGYLDQIIENREPLPHEVWRQAFGELGFLLLRYAHKFPGPYLNRARDLLIWLGARNARSAWRLSYDRRLSFEQRYQLLKLPLLDEISSREQGDKNQLSLTAKKERELAWWRTLRKYELAREWCESEVYRNPTARSALRAETTNYLRVLKDEPRQQDLRRFLSECGTDIESEVKGVLSLGSRWRRFGPAPSRSTSIGSFLRSFGRYLQTKIRTNLQPRRPSANSGITVANDEVVRRTFFVWFLKRYDWWSAFKLIFSGPERSKRIRVFALFIAVNLVALSSYVIQLDEPMLRLSFLPDATGSVSIFWTTQVVIQLGSLVLLLLVAPVLFRLFMPRGFFGSLLAWCTVIFLALKDLGEFRLGHDQSGGPITDLCHGDAFSDGKLLGYSLFFSAGILVVSAVLVAYTVTQFIEGSWRILLRTVITLGFLILGSLFWALAFALPIKFALERDVFQFDCHCVIPIVVIGSSVAVLFGLMVELIWQDQSLAEPLGEPL